MITYEQLEELWCLSKDTNIQNELLCLLRYLEHKDIIECFYISENEYIKTIQNLIKKPNIYLDTLKSITKTNI